jgi:hypothetical protein
MRGSGLENIFKEMLARLEDNDQVDIVLRITKVVFSRISLQKIPPPARAIFIIDDP